MENIRDEHPDWRQALPWILPVRRGVYLSRPKCQLTRTRFFASDRHRQPAFAKVPDEEARVVIEGIKRADTSAAPRPPTTSEPCAATAIS